MPTDHPLARRKLAAIVSGLMLFFGVLFAFVTPPLQSPDETVHFNRVVLIATGNLLPVREEERDGVMLPDSLRRFLDRHRDVRWDTKAKYTYKRLLAEIGAEAALKPATFVTIPTQSTSPVLYLPPLLGIAAGGLLDAASGKSVGADDWASLLYLGRLGNLVVLAIAVAAALVALPRFHAVVSFVALMPMTVFLAASVQYDSMSLIACLGLFVVVVRRVVHRGPFTRGELVLLGVCAFLLAHGKLVYLPLLLGLAPAVLRAGRRSALAAVGVTALGVLAGLLGALVFVPVSGTGMEGAGDQIAYLVGHIGEIPGLIARSLAGDHDRYFQTMLGRFGWLETAVPPSLLLLVWAAFLLTLVNDGRGPVRPVDAWTRAALVGGAVLSFAAVLLSLYVIWTSRAADGIGADTVTGVQGRYFIPLLPFVAVAASFNLRRLPRIAGALPDLLPPQLALQAAALGASLFMLAIRYWV